MRNGTGKSKVGRQTHMPLSRAFQISLNSLKIRFWRSIITAGGIFLGIAFLSTILTQRLMQWPLPEKIEPGYVRVAGQVVNPYDFETWRPIPADEGIKAGIPQPVVDRVARGKNAFSLTEVVQGRFQARRADKNLKRVNEEWKGLKKFKLLQTYVDAKDDKEIKIADAIKAGVPEDVARKLAGKKPTFKGKTLVELIKDKPKWIKMQIYYSTALDLDIQAGEAIDVGVPPAIARMLAGEGKAFKGSALNEAVQVNHPKWTKIWAARKKRYAIFKTVPSSAIAKLNDVYAVTLQDLLNEAKTPVGEARKVKQRDAQGKAVDSDWANVMIVNANGRRETVNLEKHRALAGKVRIGEKDYVFVPDLTSRYRMMWLVVMSLMVCTVGITNSMLMAVTERFKEIGTMKCLGAMDRFVVTLFMLESGMMGIVASVMGWATGFLLMIVLGGFTKGWDIIGTMSLRDVGATFLWSIGVGLVLTVVATIFPAQRAASMPAAMALRTEI